MLRPRILLAIMLACLTACSGTRLRVEPDGFVPGLLEFTDPVARTAGIGLLREARVHDESRVIRIWLGFGVVIPNRIVEIRVAADGRVSGEIYLHYPSDISYMDDADAKDFREEFVALCDAVVESESHVVCSSKSSATLRWSTLLDRLIGRKLFSLPDQSKLPAPKWQVHDGAAMVVELLSVDGYRSYEYTNPLFNQAPEARDAQEMMRDVGEFIHAAQSRKLTMRSSGPRGQAMVFPDVLSARGRLTRR